MSSATARRSEVRRPSVLAAALVVLGLFAMHGPPAATAAAPTAAMTSPAHRSTMGLHPATGFSATTMVCGMDHAGCVAVLRDAHESPLAEAMAVETAARASADSSALPRRNPGSRGPPTVLLVGLGISRT